MKRVTGVGGIFFKSTDPARLREWYKKHLGIDVQDWGGASFSWQGDDNPRGVGTTVWNIFDAKSNYLDPSPASFMINYRVADLVALLATLRAEGCNVVGDGESSEYGRFGWVFDPDGNKIELWEPPAGQ